MPMTYCSIEEAWGPTSTKNDRTQQFKEKLNDIDSQYDTSFKPLDKYYDINIKDSDFEIQDDDLTGMKTEKELSLLTKRNNKNNKEHFTNENKTDKSDNLDKEYLEKNKDEMQEDFINKLPSNLTNNDDLIDILILFLMGILIIFVMDSFVKLGGKLALKK
jgi:hypothetical protein